LRMTPQPPLILQQYGAMDINGEIDSLKK